MAIKTDTGHFLVRDPASSGCGSVWAFPIGFALPRMSPPGQDTSEWQCFLGDFQHRRIFNRRDIIYIIYLLDYAGT